MVPPVVLLSIGTSVDVEPLADEYIAEAPKIVESARLVVDRLANRVEEAEEYMPGLFGDGIAGLLSMSLSLEIVICFGFENNFIIDFSL